MMPIHCKICDSVAAHLFEATYLEKFQGNLYSCERCGFSFVNDVSWLQEAYAKPLADSDSPLIERPLQMRAPVSKLIQKELNPKGEFLDYGGGAGVFVRLMRDLGYRFFLYDKFSPGVIAGEFALQNIADKSRFDLITLFEVVEHLENPKSTLKELSEKADTFLISTELIPQRKEEFQSWPYLGFSHGQHISFFTEKSFEILAGQLQMNYFRVGEYLHLFSKKKIQLRNLGRNKKFEYWFSKIQFFLSLIFKNEYYWLHIKRYQDYHRSK